MATEDSPLLVDIDFSQEALGPSAPSLDDVAPVAYDGPAVVNALQTATLGDVVRGRMVGRTRGGLAVEMFDPTWPGDIVLPYISKQEWKECFVALARVSPKPRGGLCFIVSEKSTVSFIHVLTLGIRLHRSYHHGSLFLCLDRDSGCSCVRVQAKAPGRARAH